tara:strand:- start:33 stop:284 length:252 start_codon:yes stop_codon:yes gene_type:complete
VVITIILNQVIITIQDLAIIIQDLAIIIINLQVHHQEVTFLDQVTAHHLAHHSQEAAVGFRQVLVRLEVVNLEDNFKKFYYEI